MNSRQIAFLRLLLEQEEYLPVSCYAGKMDVSDKTLRRMIPGVNEILESDGGAVESRPGTGIKLEISGEERERLMNSAYMMELHGLQHIIQVLEPIVQKNGYSPEPAALFG